MSRESVLAVEQNLRHQLSPSAKLPAILFHAFIVVTALATFLPLNPAMPAAGLDYSWQFGMNQAVVQHLRFGKEIMFTFGPYASICDWSYHPATDRRMVLGSLLLCAAYLTGLLYLVRGRARYTLLLPVLFLATFTTTDSEVLLFSYPFLLIVCFLRYLDLNDRENAVVIGWSPALAAILMLSMLGLLPLIKGSLLVPAVAASITLAGYLVYRRHLRLGLVALALPATALVLFWEASGQWLSDLFPFLRDSVLLTSGYIEAMSMTWGIWPSVIGHGFEVIVLAISVLICFSLSRSTRLQTSPKWALVVWCVLYFFITFKLGFVRTPHVWTAYASLVIFILVLAMLYSDRYLSGSLAVAFIVTVGLSMCRDDLNLTKQAMQKLRVGVSLGGSARSDALHFVATATAHEFAQTTYLGLWHTYRRAWDGLGSRLGWRESFKDQYERDLAEIRAGNPLPAVSGTTDIYSYDQSPLIAANINWDPRPVLQSYSAYTLLLPEMNEQHLRGSAAPDWVIFGVEPIDGRLPSIEDGMSWPALLDNYTYTSFNGQYVLLHKKHAIRADSSYTMLNQSNVNVGRDVMVPAVDGPVFAKVDIKPTLLGKIVLLLFKPPQLHLVVHLQNGETKGYRVSSNMMATGFILSPFVNSTSDFASLAAGTQSLHTLEKVTSFSIVPSDGHSILWSKDYALTLQGYNRPDGDK